VDLIQNLTNSKKLNYNKNKINSNSKIWRWRERERRLYNNIYTNSLLNKSYI